MKNLKHGELAIIAGETSSRMTLQFIGRSVERAPSTILTPYFSEILPDLPRKLTLDFSKLEYMNSSLIPPILYFIKQLNENEIESLLLYDGSLKWQAASFKALNTISLALPYISVESI